MKKICFLFSVILLLQLMGCAKQEEILELKNEPVATTMESEEKSIQIYTIDEQNLESIAAKVVLTKGEKRTTKNIVGKVVTLFQAHAINIQIDFVKVEDDIAYISFKKNGAPVIGVSEVVEEVILESISKSIIDNMNKISKIVFKVEGNAYKSENLSLEENEVYWWK